jgi:hypothetical protein
MMSSNPLDSSHATVATNDSQRQWARAVAALLALAAVMFAFASPASARSVRVFHIAPDGTAGAGGSDWNEAGTLDDLPRFVELAEPGDEVWIRGDAGVYRTTGGISITAGGSVSGPVIVRGVAGDGSSSARPTFVGTRTAPYRPNGNPGTELFKLLDGADNLEFRNMAFVDQGNGAFRVGAAISNLAIHNMRATNVRRFFEIYRSGDARSATVSGLRISDVKVNGFSRGVIRMLDNTHDVVISDVVGDSQRQDGDRFAMGVHLDDTVHDVLLKRVTMRNSHDTVSGPYWNGDGFAAEGDTYNLRFVDTAATGSTDSGYDLKGKSIDLVRAVARDNKRNFRFWGQADMVDSVGRDPRRRGGMGSQAQVWAGHDARVRIADSTFTDKRSNTVVFAVEERADVTLRNVKVKRARGAREALVEKRARLRRR